MDTDKATEHTCIYLSFILSQDEMQFDIYKYINSDGSSADVVNLLTTSILWRDISILTRADKYSFA